MGGVFLRDILLTLVIGDHGWLSCSHYGYRSVSGPSQSQLLRAGFSHLPLQRTLELDSWYYESAARGWSYPTWTRNQKLLLNASTSTLQLNDASWTRDLPSNVQCQYWPCILWVHIDGWRWYGKIFAHCLPLYWFLFAECRVWLRIP